MSRVCTICARGGSKGVPGKNLMHIAGRPLLGISLEQARRSKLFDLIAVSSDSEEILKVAKDAGADLLIHRPPELASDTSGKVDAIRHAFQECERESAQKFDLLIDLDVTSPLRSVADIVGVVNLIESTDSGNVITGSLARRSPYFNLLEERLDGTVGLAKAPPKPILRRQDAPRCFDMNASIYAWKRWAILGRDGIFHPDTRIYVMPEERSLDIDSSLDLDLVEYLATSRKRFQNDQW